MNGTGIKINKILFYTKSFSMLVFDLYKLGFKVNDHQIQNIKLKCYIK